VVQLPAGTYHLSSGISFGAKSNITLRGAGADQTIIVFSGSGDPCTGQNADVCMASSDINYVGGPSNVANWTAGYSRGTTVLTLSTAANLQVGSPLIVDQLDDASDPGTIYICETAAGGCASDGPSGTARTNRGQIQIVTVASCSPACPNSGSTQVTTAEKIYMPNWRSSQSPQAWWATNPVSGDGVENMSLDHTAATGTLGGIMMFNCYACWVKGVRSISPGRSHVWLWTSSHVTIRDSYFYGTQNAAQTSYGIEPFPASDVLFENNIFQTVAAPQTINGACSGCVVAYNFSINQYYAPSSNWQQQSAFLHSVTDTLLFEGNVGVGIYADVFHGTHHFVTLFRNRYDGFESNNGNTTSAHTNPVILNPFSRYFNIIGNVLGSTALPHTVYDVSPGSTANQDVAIYLDGVQSTSGSPDDPRVPATLMRWGNYDVVTGTVRFVSSEVPSGLPIYANPVPGSQTLPASFYLFAKPAWWPSGKAWPPIGPDVTGGNIANVGGHANSIPAQDCYVNVMRGTVDGTGSVLTFNAARCYPNGPPPLPPTNVRAVAK
jgi:hypothetical protein